MKCFAILSHYFIICPISKKKIKNKHTLQKESTHCSLYHTCLLQTVQDELHTNTLVWGFIQASMSSNNSEACKHEITSLLLPFLSVLLAAVEGERPLGGSLLVFSLVTRELLYLRHFGASKDFSFLACLVPL